MKKSEFKTENEIYWSGDLVLHECKPYFVEEIDKEGSAILHPYKEKGESIIKPIAECRIFKDAPRKLQKLFPNGMSTHA